MKKVSEKSSRVTRGSSRNRQSDPSPSGRNTRRSLSASGNEPTSNARKRKCATEDSPAKRHNTTQDYYSMPVTKRRQFNGKPGDAFCWICHKYTDEFFCTDCPRVYHNDCHRKLKTNLDEPLCKCKWTSVDGLNSYTNLIVPSDLKDLLGFSLRMQEKNNKKLQADDSEYMKIKVWPDEFKKTDLLYEIMDVLILIDKIILGIYKSTGQFFQDLKLIYHNCYILHGPDHEMTTTALKFEKSVKQQLSDMEACGECYREKSAEFPHIEFFSKVCSTPHDIVWAKLKGFPYWPAKCLRIVNGHADVRFFGTHDKSLIPLAQVFKISRRNPGGNPKKHKNSSRMTSYEEAMLELQFYVSNYEKQFGSFQYFNEKTPLEPMKKSGKRTRQGKNGNQLEVPINIDVDGHHDTSLQQTPPLLNVSLLHDDPVETKATCRNVLRSSTVVLENLTNKNIEDLSQTSMESSVVCHMTFDEECHGEMISDEGIEGTSSSHSQLPEIPVQVTVASVKGSPELCVNVPSSQVLLNNVETSELHSNNYVNMNDNSAAMPSTSDSPLLITSTQSLSSIVSNAMSDISKINASESLASEGNIKRTFESIIGSQAALPDLLPGDDDEVQLLRENQSGNLVAGIFKNQPMLKTFCELLLGNKPNIRNYIASFQNMALHFYLAMWLEANSGKLNANECKMFHSIYEKLCKAVETLKSQVKTLKTEKEALTERLKKRNSLRELIVNAQVKKNKEDLTFYKSEIKRLLKELDDAKKCVNIFQAAKYRSEDQLELFKKEYDDLQATREYQIEVLQKQKQEEIEDLQKQKQDEIETLQKQKQKEIQALQKQKQEEIEVLQKQKELAIKDLNKYQELEFENLIKQNKEQMERNRNNEREIENLKKQKAEVEDRKNYVEEELQKLKIEFEKKKKTDYEIMCKLHQRIDDMLKQNKELRIAQHNCKCKSNSDDISPQSSASSCHNSNQPLPPFRYPCFSVPVPVFMNQPGVVNQNTPYVQTVRIEEVKEDDEERKEEEVEKEKEEDEVEKEEDEVEDEEREEDEVREENREKEEEEGEDEEGEEDEEEEYEVKEDAYEEEEEAMNLVLESESLVGSKLRSSRNTVAKPISSRNYSRTRARATTKVQKAVKLIKKATKPPKKRAAKAVIRKRK